MTFIHCLFIFFQSGQLKVCTTDRSNVLAELMNSEPELDLLMMEAIKLHMIVSAIKLYSNKSEMPTFGMLMFARDTSETPKDFMNNHLLPIGDTAGLEQVSPQNLQLFKRKRVWCVEAPSFSMS